ncbi:SDR family NAD(P)-dependent oxidoreductase [Aquibacillus halophilus]|uniref:SDR family NAD(P)-dependent oxidoreductase n=1 Tax=Aquibacillus halophilus TaxID=930132 RepID=A0A6A8DDH2_9BACI|nr:SDR family oxidoreductase [Aquibacillus halophilus]MRH43755.1 SDR family NAD(P)-dependent oxidoreductase [Aquibacillus halophilus]
MTIFSNQSLKGQHALITGATGGIGYQTALLLSEMGAKVTITGRRQKQLDELKEAILDKNEQSKVFVYRADLKSSEERNQLIQASSNENGFISLLINSAGIFGGDTVEELTKEQLEDVMDLNYTVPVLLSQQVYEDMKERKRGNIVNVSSLSGLRGTYGGTAYCGSKFALIGFTQSFALEAIKHGVRVNAVCPGYVETDMGREAIQNKADRENLSYKEQYEIASKELPSGRITSPEEVANTIAFLLTDAASNIIGESVKISGGSVMR